jgi:hypothetical protein
MGPEDIGSQFDSIIGSNFTPEETRQMKRHAKAGYFADLVGHPEKFPTGPTGELPKSFPTNEIPKYFKNFKPENIGIDENGIHAFYVGNTHLHKWRGGSSVEHYSINGPLNTHQMDIVPAVVHTGKLRDAGFTPVIGNEWDSNTPLTSENLAKIAEHFEKNNPIQPE